MRGEWRRYLAAIVVLGGLLGAAAPASAVDVQRVRAGGVEAWLVEDHGNPLIAVHFAFRHAGAAADPPGKAGLATMVSGLLDEGADDLDSRAFQTALSNLAVRLSFDTRLDSFSGRLSTLTEHRDRAFDLLRLALTAPRFDPEAIERIRGQLEARLRQRTEDPDARANRRLFEALFGDHPYARPLDGTLETLPSIARDDLVSFANQRLSLDKLVIGVVGDITAGQLAGLLETTFGGLPRTDPRIDAVDTEPRSDGAIMIEPVDAPQSAIVFAQRGLKRDDADFIPFFVMNEILGGGGLTSRLFQAVRTERGLAYSVYTAPVPLDHAALYVGGAGTINERAHETVAVIRDQWRLAAEEGFTAGEVADAKTHLTGSFPLRFTSNGSVAQMLVTMQMDNLGIDYIDRRNGLIEAVTVDDVNRLARALLDPAALTFVVAGQPTGFASE